MEVGDLVFVSSGTRLIQFREGIEDIDPNKTYIGPSPIRVHDLKKSAYLLITKVGLSDGSYNYVKVWYDGSEWRVDANEI